MITSQLKLMFNEGIYPSEEIAPKSEEYRDVNKRIDNEEQYFREKMSLDDVKRFEHLGNLYCESSSIYACECFTYGFRLGVMLMTEAFSGER